MSPIISNITWAWLCAFFPLLQATTLQLPPPLRAAGWIDHLPSGSLVAAAFATLGLARFSVAPRRQLQIIRTVLSVFKGSKVSSFDHNLLHPPTFTLSQNQCHCQHQDEDQSW